MREREEERKEKEERMSASMAARMARDGEEALCPHHPQRAEWVCVEAGHALATARRWRACHERLICIQRAMEGWRDERRALERPSPTPDVRCLLDLPPVAGWVCTPRDLFDAETAALTADTLELARRHLEWEKEEEEERRRVATPASTPHQVSESGRR